MRIPWPFNLPDAALKSGSWKFFSSQAISKAMLFIPFGFAPWLYFYGTGSAAMVVIAAAIIGFCGHPPFQQFVLKTAGTFGLWRAQKIMDKYDRLAANPPPPVAETTPPPVKITLGTSTGELLSRSHPRGVTKGNTVKFLLEDLCKNTIIFGGIGSGKTTSCINPLLNQIFGHSNVSALIFDVKGDFKNEVDYFAQIHNRPVVVVGDGGVGFNLLKGINPELVASWLKSCFLSSGQGKGDGAFWVNSAVELCRNLLTILQFANNRYSLHGLYEAAYKPASFDEALGEALAHAEELTERQQSQLVASIDWHKNVWLANDDKMKKSVLATAADVLSPFTNHDLKVAFCDDSGTGFKMLDLIESSSLMFLNLPQFKYGKEGSRITYLLMKLNFMNMMRQRRAMKKEWNQERPVFFICDEYQSIIDPVADSDFWDKSRSSKTCAIVSMQGLSSLYAAISDKNTADSILQNFRNRIMFRTEDVALMKLMQDQFGEHDVMLESQSNSSSDSFSTAQHGYGFEQSGRSDSKNASVSISKEAVFSLNQMRNLQPKQALIVATGGDGYAVEDVFFMPPIYID